MDRTYSTGRVPDRQPRRLPHLRADSPGSLFEQFAAIAIYLNDPLRHYWPDDAWQRARCRVMPHARGEER